MEEVLHREPDPDLRRPMPRATTAESHAAEHRGVYAMSELRRLSLWDVVYALNMAIACGISYGTITHALQPLGDRESDLLGGMWAVAATVFVFRETRRDSISAGMARLIATCVSFALCLLYLSFFPFTALGMAALLGIGTLVMMLLDRRSDIVTTGVTTAVVMVVAGMSPLDAWHQPLLRLIDTVVGIGVGVACKWIASHLFFRINGEPMQ
jgi:uncharacterized membrane protein YccC